jgi:uncharacterized protein
MTDDIHDELPPLSVDSITVGVPDEDDARVFYAALFAEADDTPQGLDLHGTGRLAVRRLEALAADTGADPATTGFRGWVLGSILDQPSDVAAVHRATTSHGADEVKAPKKQLFGEFSSVCRAPDGSVVKLAAASKKDRRPATNAPRPSETAVYLAVESPKASKDFYTALGMRAEHDYGDTFTDFAVSPGASRLGLMTRKSLAKDVGVDAHGEGFSALVLTHEASSEDELAAVLKAAESAGGIVTLPPDTAEGGCVGRFTDPDGNHWRVVAPG